MTIAVIWQEDGFQWCGADTRLVADFNGNLNHPMTDMATKIYSIPVATSAIAFNASPEEVRRAHYWTEYGFVFAGAASPASMTAINASMVLRNLIRPGSRVNPPSFEDIAQLVTRLAKQFMRERRQLGSDGLFQAAFFGWCPHAERYKLAHIDGRDDGGFRVDLHYSDPPAEGEPWHILGSGKAAFENAWLQVSDNESTMKRKPFRAIQRMLGGEMDATVGGAVSLGFAHRHGFNPVYTLEQSGFQTRSLFNGLDLDTDIGSVGQYTSGLLGIA